MENYPWTASNEQIGDRTQVGFSYEKPESYGFGTGLKYGFLHTPIPALMRKAMQPSFIEDPEYDVFSDATSRYPLLMATYPEAFTWSKSREQTDYIASELQRFMKEQDAVAQSGIFGMVGAFAGGLIDPIVLVPFVGAAAKAKQAKTLSDVMRVAGSSAVQVGGAVAASEALGSVADPVHDQTDTLKAFAFGATLGAFFGGASAKMAQRGYKAVERAIVELENGGIHKAAVNEFEKTTEEAIQALVDPKGVYTPNRVSKAVLAVTKKLSPVTRMLESPFEYARKLQGVLSDASLVTKTAADGKVVAEVGTIENRMHRNFAPLALALNKVNQHYVEYITGKAPEHFIPEQAGFLNVKEFMKKYIPSMEVKLTAQEFEHEVVKAIAHKGEHEIPAVRKAAKAVNEAFKQIGEEMGRVGLIPEEVAKSSDWYMPISLDFNKILANPNQFVEDILPYVSKNLGEKVAAWTTQKDARIAKLVELKHKLSQPEKLVEHVKQLQDDIASLRKGINEKFSEFQRLTGKPLTVGTIKQVNKLEMPQGMMVMMKDKAGKLSMRPMTKEEWLKGIKKFVDSVKRDPEWKRYAEQEKLLSSQLKELRKFAPAPGTAKAAEKTLKNASEKAAGIIERAATRVSKFVSLKRKNVPQLRKLKTEFSRLQDDLKLLQKEGLVLSDEFNELMVRAGKILERKGVKEEALASEFWKNMEEVANEIIEKAASKTLEVGKKVGKAENVLKVDEKAIKAKLAEIEQELAKLGEEGPPIEFVAKDGKVDIEETARKYLWDVVVKKKKSSGGINQAIRLMTAEERGSELARVAFKDVPNHVMYPWVHNDVSSMMRSYFRTVAGDIELKRTFDTVSVDKILEPLKDEFRSKLEAAKTQVEREKIVRAYDRATRDLTAEILRVRGMFGLPENPDTWYYQFGEGLLHWNVATKLGMVVFPSTGDITKTMLKAGPKKFMRAATQTLLQRLRKEAKGWDPKAYALNLGVTERLMATRLKQIAQTADELATTNSFLRSARWISGKSLSLTGLPVLNQWMKELAIATSATFYNDAIKRLADAGEKALTKKELQLLTNFGIDRKMAKRIMEQARSDPFTYWDKYGNWFENTSRWTDEGARLVYESMLSSEASRYVVTPGLEKPLFADSSMYGRLIYQFRGYLFSSTQKILLSGLQHPDAAFAATFASSAVLGVAQLWLRGQLIGGEFKKKMDNWSTAKWIDEAIDQSGMLGVFTEGNRLVNMLGIPYATAQWWLQGSSQYSARYAGQNAFTAAAGPSASLLWYQVGPLVGEVMRAMRGDGEITDKVIRRIRGLTPLNNNLILRHGFDILEKSAVKAFDLPEKSR